MALIVDAHLHVWRAQPAGPPGAATLVSPEEDVPIEEGLHVLDRHGVARAVLIQPVFPGEDNRYVADCAAACPDRLAAVCVVDPRAAGAEDRLEHWVVGRGCRGLRLRPKLVDESAAFGPRSYSLWERARRLGIVISVLANPEHLSTLAALAARFPEVPIVLDHLAHPRLSEGVAGPGFQSLLSLVEFPNIHVKISGFYYFTTEPEPYHGCWDLVQALYDQFGSDRLIWGSDFPHVERRTGYGSSLELVQHRLPFLSGSDREKILGRNALRLYWPRDRQHGDPEQGG